MKKTVNIKITAPEAEYPYQKTFPIEMPLVEFKRRIELVVGIYAADMVLSLLNAEGKFVTELRQEGKTLSELGVQEDFTVEVKDKSGKFVDPLSGSVEHYKINDDNYEQREESFRNFKKRNIPAHIAVGNRCIVTSKLKGNRSGQIAYVGEVDFKPDEVMIGVVLDEPLGKHDGSVDGKRYFECQQLHGVFVEKRNIKPEVTELKMPVSEQELGVVEEI
ncbi:Tubulin-folding cofactor B [Aphelenchoides bicaudatus]|nr:Tubulin-folding cofactor B [Aphelenchoides bicaudatus]